VLATLPPLCVKVTVLVYVPSEVRQTSNPVGAVTVIFAVKFDPEAEKLWYAEAVPAQLLKAVRVPLVEIVDVAVACEIGLLVEEVVLYIWPPVFPLYSHT
jgi:hypothetical protein